MKVKITKYEIERVRKDNVEYTLPDEVTYWFQTGIRRSIKMIPIWTTWQKETKNIPEEIWKCIFILVYADFKCKIETVEVFVSDIEFLMNQSEKHADLNPMVAYLNNRLEKRTKNQFDLDLEVAMDKIKTYTEL